MRECTQKTLFFKMAANMAAIFKNKDQSGVKIAGFQKLFFQKGPYNETIYLRYIVFQNGCQYGRYIKTVAYLM